MASHSLFRELRRRHVFRVAAAYAVTAWLLLQIAAILFPAFDAPHWAIRAVFGVLVLGFPVALAVAWAYEVTPEGLRRTRLLGADGATVTHRARRVGMYMNAAIVVLLVAAVGVLAWRLATRPVVQIAGVAGAATAGRPAARIPAKSVAVLPFLNLSADPANEYFSAGIRDEILTKLANLNDLKVIARTSTDTYGSHPPDLAAVGRELGVATVLEGSVQKSGNEVLINVQLIDVRTRAHVWAQSYDRTLADVFAVESEVAEQVANALNAKLAPDEAARLAAAPTTNPRAYDWYLKGEYQLDQGWAGVGNPQSEFEAAIADYRKALGEDPGFALAWARLALAHLLLYHSALDRRAARLAEAKQALDQARRLAPELATTRLVQGFYDYWGHADYAGGLAEFKLALRRAPEDSEIYSAMAGVYRHLGEWPAAIAADRKAVDLDPRDSLALTWLGDDYYSLHRYAEAEQIYLRALAVDPTNVNAVESLVTSYAEAGQLDRALAVLDAVPRDIRGDPIVLWNRSWVLMLEGDYPQAIRVLASIPVGGVSEYARFSQLALAERMLGNRARASDYASKAAALLEQKLAEEPDNPDLHMSLGWAYALTGKADAAIREGKRAVALDPVARDGYSGPVYLEGLAEIYALLGRAPDAVGLLERLLPMPGSIISVPLLRLNPVWSTIRKDSSFQSLLEELGTPASGAAPARTVASTRREADSGGKLTDPMRLSKMTPAHGGRLAAED